MKKKKLFLGLLVVVIFIIGFKVHDVYEYDQWKLEYLNEILGITAKKKDIKSFSSTKVTLAGDPTYIYILNSSKSNFKKYDFEAKKNQWITWDYLQQVVDECVEDDKVELDVNEFKKDEFEFGFLQRGSAFNYVFHKKGTSEYIVINCNI